jgi:dihydroorotate dehydrogenase electron transfer subunit
MERKTCRVVRQTELSPDIYKLELEADSLSGLSRSGQFVHIRVREGNDPLLRRPFSIHDADPDKGTLEILYRVVGSGTALMCNAVPGDSMDLIGPLGNGFQTGRKRPRVLIVAGGMGIAPVPLLVRELIRDGKKVDLLWGVRCETEFFDLNMNGVRTQRVCEEGSGIPEGLVTDLLEKKLPECFPGNQWEGFVCGPVAMLARVSEMIAAHDFPWQVSMEERMACGIGVCMGCAAETKSGEFRMVCSEGPVFDLKEMVLNG